VSDQHEPREPEGASDGVEVRREGIDGVDPVARLLRPAVAALIVGDRPVGAPGVVELRTQTSRSVASPWRNTIAGSPRPPSETRSLPAPPSIMRSRSSAVAVEGAVVVVDLEVAQPLRATNVARRPGRMRPPYHRTCTMGGAPARLLYLGDEPS
jgi:hypothetical protein